MGRTRRPVVIDSGTIGPPRGRMLLQRAQADCTRPRYSAPCLPIERNADTVLICDGGEFAQWDQSMLSVRRRLVNGVAGAIGASLSFAISARLLEPEAPVFAVLGDGTIGFHLAELKPPCAGVGPSLLFLATTRAGMRRARVSSGNTAASACTAVSCYPPATIRWLPPRAAMLEFVDNAADLQGAIERALANGKPACINIMVESIAAPVVRQNG
jgi:acetolactate synthase-1/2/3 large subunit